MADASALRASPKNEASFRPAGLAEIAKGRSFWLVLIGILALAAALRLPGLSARSLWLDESYSAWFAALSLHELWTEAPLYETHPPLYYTLLKGWITLFGDSEAAIRSLSLGAGLATVLLAGLAGRILRLGVAGDKAALLGALMLAINPAGIVYAQEARPYALQMLAASGTILSALSLAGMFCATQARPPLRSAAMPIGCLAATAGAMLWLHNTSVFIAFGLWLGLATALLAAPRGNRLPGLAAAFIAGLLALAIWSPFLPMLIEQSRSVTRTAFWVKAETQDLWSAWTLVAGGTQLLLPILFAALLGLIAVGRRSLPLFLVLAGILVVPLAAVLIIHFTVRPIFIDRLFVWLAPPVMMLAAIGLLHGPSSGLLRLSLALLIIGLNLFTSGTRPSDEDWRGLVATIARETRPGDLLVALPSEIDPAISYYARHHPDFPETVYVPGPFPFRAPDRIYVGNLGAPQVEARDVERLEPVLAAGHRIWLVSRRADLYDPGNAVRRAVAKGRHEAAKLSAGPITIALFE